MGGKAVALSRYQILQIRISYLDPLNCIRVDDFKSRPEPTPPDVAEEAV